MVYIPLTCWGSPHEFFLLWTPSLWGDISLFLIREFLDVYEELKLLDIKYGKIKKVFTIEFIYSKNNFNGIKIMQTKFKIKRFSTKIIKISNVAVNCIKKCNITTKCLHDKKKERGCLERPPPSGNLLYFLNWTVCKTTFI